MSISKVFLQGFLASVLLVSQAIAQKADRVENGDSLKSAEQRSEQGTQRSNAQWSESATRGHDRAAEVRQEPQLEKEQEQEKEQQRDQQEAGKEKADSQKDGKQKDNKPQKNSKGKKK